MQVLVPLEASSLLRRVYYYVTSINTITIITFGTIIIIIDLTIIFLIAWALLLRIPRHAHKLCERTLMWGLA